MIMTGKIVIEKQKGKEKEKKKVEPWRRAYRLVPNGNVYVGDFRPREKGTESGMNL